MENHVYLSSGVQVVGVVGVTWRATTRITAGVGDLVQRTGDGQAQVGYSVAGRSGGQVTLCVVYNMRKEMRSMSFLVQPQNQGLRFVNGLASKPLQQFLLIWPQNRWLWFLLVWHQNLWLQFLWFGVKTTRSSFSVLASKPATVVW
jgi:hypothetical protein